MLRKLNLCYFSYFLYFKKTEKSNNGDIIKTAGTTPINALAKAAIVKDIIISLNLIGETNRLVKFLLQISSRKSILKLMLDLNKKSYSTAALKIIPTP